MYGRFIPCLTLKDPVSQRLDDVCSRSPRRSPCPHRPTTTAPSRSRKVRRWLREARDRGKHKPMARARGWRHARSPSASSTCFWRFWACFAISPPTWSVCCPWPLPRSHSGCCWCWRRSAGGVPDVGSSSSGRSAIRCAESFAPTCCRQVITGCSGACSAPSPSPPHLQPAHRPARVAALRGRAPRLYRAAGGRRRCDGGFGVVAPAAGLPGYQPPGSDRLEPRLSIRTHHRPASRCRVVPKMGST